MEIPEFISGFSYGFATQLSLQVAFIIFLSCWIYGTTKINLLLLTGCLLLFVDCVLQRTENPISFANGLDMLASTYITVLTMGLYSPLRNFNGMSNKMKILFYVIASVFTFGLVAGLFSAALPKIQIEIFVVICVIEFLPPYLFSIYFFFKISRLIRSNPVFKMNPRQRRLVIIVDIISVYFAIFPLLFIGAINTNTDKLVSQLLVAISVFLAALFDSLLTINKNTEENSIMFNETISIQMTAYNLNLQK